MAENLDFSNKKRIFVTDKGGYLLFVTFYKVFTLPTKKRPTNWVCDLSIR